MKRKIFFSLILLLSCLTCLSWAESVIGATEDPLRIGVGARAMGMGRAFVAVADDSTALFNNPAGLSEIKAWQVSSMYSNVLNEIPYTTFSAAQPFNLKGVQGSLAVGCVGSGVYGIPSPSQAGFNYFSYHNNVYLVALAGKITPALSAGATLKLFDEGFDGSVNALGSGHDLDLGIKYDVSKQATVGLTVQNILPVSMGGKVEWAGGNVESVPAELKVGTAIKLYDNRLRLALDEEVWLSRRLPSQLHVGTEWAVDKFLTLRGGMDQSVMTLGVGLKFGGVKFDYAYHPFGEEMGNTTHFFSISFSPEFKTKTYVPLPLGKETIIMAPMAPIQKIAMHPKLFTPPQLHLSTHLIKHIDF